MTYAITGYNPQASVNGGGRITREYGLGRKRTDLLIEWPLDEQTGWQGDIQRIVLELKLSHTSSEKTLHAGLTQTAAYADQCGAAEAHLLIFDRRPHIAWDDRIQQHIHQTGNRQISSWWM